MCDHSYRETILNCHYLLPPFAFFHREETFLRMDSFANLLLLKHFCYEFSYHLGTLVITLVMKSDSITDMINISEKI